MPSNRNFQFIDLFSGAGGLSLGLMNSGWKGLFAVEQTPDAFKTLKHNLIKKGMHNNKKPRFYWPNWLEVEPYNIKIFINDYKKHLKKLKGKVNLVAGGPPCQGFSFAGKRVAKDTRNGLFKYHFEIVDIIQPEFVLLENVKGIEVAFGNLGKRKHGGRGRPPKSYALRIQELLEKHGYQVQPHTIRASDFGIPQFRPRYFTLGIRRDLIIGKSIPNLFEVLKKIRTSFLQKRGLPQHRPVTVSEAISDLKVRGKKLVDCADPESPRGFKEIIYEGPKSYFQKLMHGNLNGNGLNSLRLVNHRPQTIDRFKEILRTCRKGVQLTDADRLRMGINKTSITPLAPNKPSHTLTTLPDDLLHYSEPRVHTVREYARLQAFPDWFEFLGKYTTGGDRRVRECPRYTQVGNAVPPLLAEIIGKALLKILADLRK